MAVGREGVRLAAAAVQGEHQLGVQLLVERVLPGQRLQLGQEPLMLAQREPDEARVRAEGMMKKCQHAALRINASQA